VIVICRYSSGEENLRGSGTSAAGLSESSCLLHESRTKIIVRMDLRSLVELAHVSAGRVGTQSTKPER
jgi:hypothetical protein